MDTNTSSTASLHRRIIGWVRRNKEKSAMIGAVAVLCIMIAVVCFPSPAIAHGTDTEHGTHARAKVLGSAGGLNVHILGSHHRSGESLSTVAHLVGGHVVAIHHGGAGGGKQGDTCNQSCSDVVHFHICMELVILLKSSRVHPHITPEMRVASSAFTHCDTQFSPIQAHRRESLT